MRGLQHDKCSANVLVMGTQRNSTQIQRARRFRREANYPERIAWETLRKLRAHGFAVRRQHPVGPYVVDFAITKAQLVIEIDGGIHRLDEVVLRDEIRAQEIRQMGWRVLRVDAQHAIHPDHLWRVVVRAIGME